MNRRKVALLAGAGIVVILLTALLATAAFAQAPVPGTQQRAPAACPAFGQYGPAERPDDDGDYCPMNEYHRDGACPRLQGDPGACPFYDGEQGAYPDADRGSWRGMMGGMMRGMMGGAWRGRMMGPQVAPAGGCPFHPSGVTIGTTL